MQQVSVSIASLNSVNQRDQISQDHRNILLSPLWISKISLYCVFYHGNILFLLYLKKDRYQVVPLAKL